MAGDANRPASDRPGARAATLVAALLLMFVLGAVYAYGVLMPALMGSFGWERSVAALPQSVLLFVYALGMGAGGHVRDRSGPRRVAFVGAAAFGVGLLVASRAQGLAGWLLGYGLVAALGFGFAYVACVTAVMSCFPHRRGLVAGAVVGSFGLGAFVWAPLVQRGIASLGWQETVQRFGLAALVVGPALALLVRAPAPGAPATARGHDHAHGFELGDALRHPLFWTVFAGYTLATAAGLLLLAHVVLYGVSRGMEPLRAALLLSALSAGSALGRVGMGALSDRIGRFPALVGVSVAEVALLLVLAAGVAGGPLFVVSALAGFVYGTWLSLYGPTATDLFGMKAAGAIYGALYLSYGIGGLVGPLAGGLLADAAGSYRPAFVAAAAASAVGALLFALAARMGHPRRPERPRRKGLEPARAVS